MLYFDEPPTEEQMAEAIAHSQYENAVADEAARLHDAGEAAIKALRYEAATDCECDNPTNNQLLAMAERYIESYESAKTILKSRIAAENREPIDVPF